jgi:chromosome segregation ATPase
MNVEIASLVLATGAAALLTMGGALLKTAIVTPRASKNRFAEPAPPGASAEPAPSEPIKADVEQLSLKQAEQALASLTNQLAECMAAREAQREETVELRQRLERQVQAAESEASRLATELDSLRKRTAELEQSTQEGRLGLAAVEKEAAAAKEERDAAQSKCEALERLIEGVRARSRALADELKTLKGGS